MEGIIYILTNPAFPDLIKIGKTTQDDVATRAAQLYTTGLPFPFDVKYASVVDKISEVEKSIHFAFDSHRVNARREFFQVEPEKIIAIIKLVEIRNITDNISPALEIIDKQDFEAAKEYVQRRPRFKFSEMDIPVGSEIVFTGDGEKAIVLPGNKVSFRNEELTLTSATRLALGEGYAYNIAPLPYWLYNGKRLSAIYNSIYQTEN